jgi:hypothetical protein
MSQNENHLFWEHSRLQKYPSSMSSPALHALIDHANNRITAISKKAKSLHALNYPDQRLVFFFNQTLRPILPKDFDTSQPWQYKWDHLKRQYYDDDLKDKNLIERYRLTAEKVAYIDKMYSLLDFRLIDFHAGQVQSEIYNWKSIEAQQIIDSNDTIDDDDVPMIVNYAKLVDVSRMQAAQMILLQRDISRSRLTDIEYIRQKYIFKFRQATELNQLYEILCDFEKEFETYASM